MTSFCFPGKVFLL